MLLVFAVKDTAVGQFLRPWFVPHKALAVRAFSDEVNRQSDDNPLWKHPKDFDLFLIGQYDEDTGELVSQSPDLVLRGISAAVPVSE